MSLLLDPFLRGRKEEARRVFLLSRQIIGLRAASGRGIKVEGALVVITGYRCADFCSGVVSRYKAEHELVVIPGTVN